MSQFLDRIEECVPPLRRYARALTHNSDLADDLVQDCLERAIRKSGLWRPTGSLQAWLFKMLLNIYRNDLRQRRRAPESMPIASLPADRRCTASFGVAELRPGGDFDTLMRRADQALYDAKKGGRDCVRLAVAPDTDGMPLTGRG